jgi:tRNA-binding protein
MINADDLQTIDFSDFLKVGMVVGTILAAELNPQAKKAAYRLSIDFGEWGIKQSSAQITENYKPEDLVGMQVVAVINFPPKKVAGLRSEVLVLAAVCQEKGTVLLQPTEKVKNGTRIL